MKRIMINAIILILLAGFAAMLIVFNVAFDSVKVATVPGSYAEEYADKHHLDNLSLSDSNVDWFDYRYEEFSFNLDYDGLIIESYNGQSESVIIPESIADTEVVAIGKDFFSNSPQVNSVYLPLSVTRIDAESAADVEIHVGTHSNLINELDSEKWNIIQIIDSEYISINFDLGDNPYHYNVINGSVVLSSYTGHDRVLVIPSHINGMPVVEVSFDMMKYKGVVFPDTINEISGKTYEYDVSALLIIELSFALLAILMTMISINFVIPGRLPSSTGVIAPAQSVISVGYVLSQLIVAFVVLKPFIEVGLPIAIIINVVLLIAFVVFSLMLMSSKQHIEKTIGNQEETSADLKQIKNTIRSVDVNKVDDATLRNSIEKLFEDINYSFPVDNKSVKDLDYSMKNEVDELIDSINHMEEDGIQERINNIQGLLQQRKRYTRL